MHTHKCIHTTTTTTTQHTCTQTHTHTHTYTHTHTGPCYPLHLGSNGQQSDRSEDGGCAATPASTGMNVIAVFLSFMTVLQQHLSASIFLNLFYVTLYVY